MTNFSFKKVAFAVALALGGSQAAMAFDGAGGSGQNGNLILTVFDTVAGNSLVQVLQHPSVGDGTINYQEFREPLATPDAGLSLSFNVDLSFFTNNGSSLSNLRYTVFAGDSGGIVNSSGGGQGTLFTSAPGLTITNLTTADVTAMNTYYGNVAATFGAAALIGTGVSFGPGYFGSTQGGTPWGERFGASNVNGAAALDSSLGFYYMTKVSNTSGTAAPVVAFQNADGLAATWSLSSAGVLTYVSPPSGVPLPAAVWLLQSGIGGLGVMGRRRAVTAAA